MYSPNIIFIRLGNDLVPYQHTNGRVYKNSEKIPRENKTEDITSTTAEKVIRKATN
jgi:hypothetical protein